MTLHGSAWRGAGLTLLLTGVALAQPAATPAQPASSATRPVTAAPAAAAPRPATAAAPAPTAARPAPAAATATPAGAPIAATSVPTTTPAVPSETPVPAPVQEKKAAAPAKPAAPLTRTRSNIAILQALDKVTTETIRFEAPVGQPVRYKTLVFTVRACETTAADEPVQDYSAYVLIDSQALPTPGKAVPPARQAFRGWMYARSPGLNPLQHPVYDAWLISCRTTAPATAAAPPAKR